MIKLFFCCLLLVTLAQRNLAHEECKGNQVFSDCIKMQMKCEDVANQASRAANVPPTRAKRQAQNPMPEPVPNTPILDPRLLRLLGFYWLLTPRRPYLPRRRYPYRLPYGPTRSQGNQPDDHSHPHPHQNTNPSSHSHSHQDTDPSSHSHSRQDTNPSSHSHSSPSNKPSGHSDPIQIVSSPVRSDPVTPCVAGCTCPEGLYWSDVHSNCVSKTQCHHSCSDGMVYHKCMPCKRGCEDFDCGTHIQTGFHIHYCASPNECKAGCACPVGKVWDKQHTKCVIPSQCHHNPHCNPDQMCRCVKCVPSCPSNRSGMTSISQAPCHRQSCTHQCVCKDNKLLDQFGSCVVPLSCPFNG